MALEGNVKDFGLSEIFQLISLQKKSGMLSVTGEENMVIFFRDGFIISTRDRRSRGRDPLKDYLMRYGFLGRDEMNQLQQIQAETKLDLVELLLTEKYFSEDELATIWRDQIQESVTEVLSWPKSYYKFIIGRQVLQGIRSFDDDIKVEGVLMECMRRIDEFPEMRKIFSSEEMILGRLPLPTEDPPSLDRNEEIVYELLERGRTLGDLVSKARMARFCTYESLKQLLEKELLEITREAAPTGTAPVAERPRMKEPGPGRKQRRVLPTIAAAAALAACFVVGEYLAPRLLPPGWTARSRVVRAPIEKRLDEAAIRAGLEEYAATRGSYPITLDVLAARRILPAGVIERAGRDGLRYRPARGGAGYELSRDRSADRRP
ncbi:MAG: DUF4388 domain-containing protein [Candidatus Krumholzibacteriota bacterium]|nr:DUF4388 domain-containing protein [Candidatus Krumholzibacteriota bacterium]